MEYTELNKILGIMVLIDFEKAFDTLEWHFLQNMLKYFNFGPNLRNWISVMYLDVHCRKRNNKWRLCNQLL